MICKFFDPSGETMNRVFKYYLSKAETLEEMRFYGEGDQAGFTCQVLGTGYCHLAVPDQWQCGFQHGPENENYESSE